MVYSFTNGSLSELREEEERRAREEEEALAAEEAKKREEEEKAAALRKQREEERQKAMEQARLQRQREEEAEARRAARAAERKAQEQQAARPNGFSRATEGGDAWRRGAPRDSVPSTPIRASAALPPARSESPAPTPRFGRGGAAGGGLSWREREAAKKAAEAAGGSVPSRPETPVSKPREEEDGFQPVPAKNVWRPSRGRGGRGM